MGCAEISCRQGGTGRFCTLCFTYSSHGDTNSFHPNCCLVISTATCFPPGRVTRKRVWAQSEEMSSPSIAGPFVM